MQKCAERQTMCPLGMMNLNRLEIISKRFRFQANMCTSFKSSNFHRTHTHICRLLLFLIKKNKSTSIANMVFTHCTYGRSCVYWRVACQPACLPACMCASCNLHEFFILFLSIERTSDILRYLSRFSKRSICERPQTKQNYINEGEKNESE